MHTTISLVRKTILQAIHSAQVNGQLPQQNIHDSAVERPHDIERGDYASSLPLKLSRDFAMDPITIGTAILDNLTKDYISYTAKIVRPGFINIHISKEWLLDQINLVRENPLSYFHQDLGEGKKAQVEYISANPTGRLHVAHARGAVIGSTLANILRATGYDVQEEYYLNDQGNQIAKFNESLLVRYKQLFGTDIALPEGGYPGEDVIEAAKALCERHGNQFEQMTSEEALKAIDRVGIKIMVEKIMEDIESLKISFDSWFSEASLFKTGRFQECMDILDRKDLTEKIDGATWLLSKNLGEEKNNVLIRSTGSPTYFATDIAYHYDKFTDKNFDLVIDVWGADHQGQVARLKSALAALGTNPDHLRIIIVQMVRFRNGAISERLSKRTGNIIPLQDLVSEIGADACRFLFLSKAHDSQLEFDLDLAKSQSSDNPIYYLQYAHARICSLLRLASEKNINFDNADVSILRDPLELIMLRKMITLPEIIEVASKNLEPHHIPHYSTELATTFHLFYHGCRVISEDDLTTTQARLKLVDSMRISLKFCLDLMGMGAPETM